MGKVTRLKGDLDDVAALLEIISVLKDVSTNRFFVFAQRKKNFQYFLEKFLSFFEMLGDVDTKCPLIKNTAPGVDIVVITSEQSFMAQLNGRVSSVAVTEYSKHANAKLICIGQRGADKCRSLGMQVEKVFPSGEMDRYELAIAIRDFLIERIMSGKSGRAIVVYLWAKSFSILKPRIVTLLPATELMGEENADGEASVLKVKKSKADFIQETSLDDIVRSLADIWVHARLFEIINDLQIVESAAQAQQLESAIEGLSSEKKALTVSFRKAGREELNKAMREVFTQTSMMKQKR